MIPDNTYFDGAYYMEEIDDDETNDLVELLKSPAQTLKVQVEGSDAKGKKVENLNLNNKNWKAIGFKTPRNQYWTTTRIQFTTG